MITQSRSWLVKSLLVALIIFLPLSAWLVSFTGNQLIGLGRDVSLVLLLIILFWRLKTRPVLFNLAAGLFLLEIILSFYWREESLSQWLRGLRFVGEPILLFLLLANVPLSEKVEESVWQTMAITLGVVVVIGFLEYLFPIVVRTHLGAIQTGYLGQIHLAGAYKRMQSVLAGPNALGLYLMMGLLFFGWGGAQLAKRSGWAWLPISGGLIALVLTFSRSAWLGYLISYLVGLAFSAHLPKHLRLVITITVIVVGLLITRALIDRSASWLTRDFSGQIRLEQYQRVWRERGEIGLLGRGPGSAGLASQNRLDNGPNYYTENSYLDTFEGLGFLGGALYLLLWFSVLIALWRSSSKLSQPVFYAGLGLAIAGIFINHYTGQAAIWLFWLLAALALNSTDPIMEVNG